MHYELTENEFNRIQDSMRQMDLVTDLCSYVPQGYHALNTDGLQSFLCAQQEVLHATLKALAERQEAQRKANQNAAEVAASKPTVLPISADLLVRVMQVCSGAIQDDKAIMELNSELYDATVTQGEAEPLRAFYTALHRQGCNVSTVVGNGMQQTTIKRVKSMKSAQPAKPPKVATRKRERLVGSV